MYSGKTKRSRNAPAEKPETKVRAAAHAATRALIGEECLCCGRAASSPAVEVLIEFSPGLYICNECVDLCNSLIASDRATRATPGGAEVAA